LRSGLSASEGAGVPQTSKSVDRKSMGHTMADRSSNEADFLCILMYLAWRLRKRVVTLAVTGNTNTSGVLRRQRVPEIKWHRLPLIGSRWDIRWLIGRRTKPFFCVFHVSSVAVLAKCCDACFYGNYYLRSGFWRQRVPEFHEHQLALTGSRWDIRWLIGRRTNPTFCVFGCI
jgi:hypothetical protein